MGGNQVENHTTFWSNLQDCKISSRVEIPKLDPSVAIKREFPVERVEVCIINFSLLGPSEITTNPEYQNTTYSLN